MLKQKSHSKKSKKNPKSLLMVAGILLLAGAVLVGLEKKHVTNFVKNPLSSDTAGTADEGPTPDQKATEDAQNAANKQQLIENETPTVPNKAAETPTATPAPSSQSITLSARQESNNTVTVFTKLYNYSSGSCSLTVTNGGQTNSQTATVMYQPEYATCAGFSVPTNDLGTGTWNINLKVISNGATTTKSISFEVN